MHRAVLLVAFMAVALGGDIASTGGSATAADVPSGWNMSLTVANILDPAEFPPGSNFVQHPLHVQVMCYAVPKSAVSQQVQTTDYVAGLTIPFGGATRYGGVEFHFNQEAIVPITVEDATNVAYVDCYITQELGQGTRVTLSDSDSGMVIQIFEVTPTVQRVIFTPDSLSQGVSVVNHYEVVYPPPLPIVIPPTFTG